MADDVQDCMVRLFAHLSLALRIGAVAAALILSIGALATGNKLALAQLSVPEAVTGVSVEAKYGALRVSWTALEGVSGYKVQWKSGFEQFHESRELRIADPGASESTIRELSPNIDYTLRVLAYNAGASDTNGPPSAEVTRRPLKTGIVILLSNFEGGLQNSNVLGGQSVFVVIFSNVNPTGFTEDDLEITGGYVVDFDWRVRPGATSLQQRMVIAVDADANEEFVLRIPEDVVVEGNHAAEFRSPAVEALKLAMATDAVAPVRRDFTLDLEFSETVNTELNSTENVSGYFRLTRLQYTNGSYVRHSGLEFADTEFRIVVRPRANFEGELEVLLPGGTVAVARSRVRYNLESIFRIAVDTKAPAFDSARLNGTALTIHFHEAFDADSVPDGSHFEVKVNGATARLASNSPVALSGNHVTLALAEAPAAGSTVTVSYSRPSSGGRLKDEPGNEVGSFRDREVSLGNTAPGRPRGLSATAGDGQTLLTWRAPASDGGAVIDLYQYRVSADGGTNWAPDWTDIPDGPGAGTGDEISYAATGLRNGTVHSFELRAVNSVGEGAVAATTATPRENSPATGKPMVEGIERVPSTLTADNRAIRDQNGLPPESGFAYQWVRVNGGIEREIGGATGSAYTLTDADAGKRIKVRVSFTDNAGNSELVSSDAFPSGMAPILPRGVCRVPAYPSGTTQIWQGTVTVGRSGTDTFGFLSGSAGSISDRNFTIDGTTYAIDIASEGQNGIGSFRFSLDRQLPAEEKRRLLLYLCDKPVNFSEAAYGSRGHHYDWTGTGVDWSAHVTRSIYLGRDGTAPNLRSATVDGTELVLTFNENLDGGSVPAASAFAVSAGGVPVGLAASKPVLVSDKTVSLLLARAITAGTATVSYTKPASGNTLRDGAHNEVASFAGLTVTVNAEPMASNGRVRTREDVPYAFTVDDFNFNDNDASHELVSVSVLEPPARGTLALNGTALVEEAEVTRFEIDGGRLVFTPAAHAHGDAYTSFAFEVSDGTAKSDSYTMTIDVTAENDEAAGPPTIWGTARVGQTLRALTDRIVDFDGLTNTIYSYQWIRVDGPTETDIEDATEQTHNLTTDDVGKQLKVRVSFNDDDGNSETLTSAVFPASGEVTTNITIGSSANMLVSNITRSNEHGGDNLSLGWSGALYATKFTTGGNTKGYELDSVEIGIFGWASSNGVLLRVVPEASGRPNFNSRSSVITLRTPNPIAPGTSRFVAPPGTILDASRSYYVVISGSNGTHSTGYSVHSSPAGLTDGGAADGWSIHWDGRFSSSGIKNWYPWSRDGKSHALAFRVNGVAIKNSIPKAADATVSTVADTAYTFDAGDFNFTDGDSGDTLTSLTVVTLPAKGTLALDGAAVTADQAVTRDDIDAGRLVFTPVTGERGDPYTSFTFKVGDKSGALSELAYTMTIQVVAQNDVSAPGTPRGVTATAGDARALLAWHAPASNGGVEIDKYQYRVSADGGGTWNRDWTDIPDGADAGSSTRDERSYTAMGLANGMAHRLEVRAVNGEGAGPAANASVTPVATACAAPDLGDRREVWTGLLSVSSNDRYYGYYPNLYGSLDNRNIEFGAYRFTIYGTWHPKEGAQAGALFFSTTGSLSNPPRLKMTLHVCDGAFPFSEVTGISSGRTHQYKWFYANQDWSEVSTRRFTLSIPPNNDATGAPTISGTARVGQVLTADVSGIADVDGLPDVLTFEYQWLRVDGGNEADEDIDGATGSTYRPVAADAGKQVRVRVSFTDKLGGEESAISEVYPNPGTIAANAAPTGADRTVTVAEDEPYTFGASEFEFADTDGDALASVKITALPAAGKGTLALDGVAVEAAGVVEASDLGKLVYVPPADANGSSYASFTFKVSDGGSESAAPYTMTIDVTAVNDAATGAPTISGTARVGEELTAEASGIADVDRLPDVSTFEYQWLQVDGGSDTDVEGATAKTYRLVAGDLGKKFKVRVSFTDLDGTEESLTSAAYPSSGSVGQSLACHAPDLGERREVWTGEVSVGAGNYGIFGDFYGYYVANGGSVDNPNIEFGAYRYTVDGAFHPSEGSRKGALYFSTVNYLPNEPRLKMTLHVCGEDFPYTASTAALFWGQHREWSHANQDWSEVSTRRLRLSIPPDNDATGVPTISGTARVGEELTADAGAIADVDGLPDVTTFEYQWVRVASGSEADIDGATGSTYRSVEADAGTQVRVRVSFTDKLGGEESAISEVYPNPGTIAANTAPSAANGTVTVDEDTSYTFQTGDFAFADTDGDVLASVKITALPAAGTLALDGTAVTADQEIAASALGKLVYTPPADANDPGYASFTFKVSDGTSESAAPYTVTINVTAVNDAATGAPTITGTARVGQVLTAEASGIADVDGLPAPSAFAWQWLRVDSGSDTVIAGATARTYRLVAGDAGKKFKVRVGFTDLDGTAEALTSAAYPAALEQVVPNAVPTSANLAVTVDEDTSYTFQTGDFAFADEDDGDVLASVKITALPAAGTLALDGTAVAADQEIAASDLGKLVYTPPADANDPGYASFAFKVSDGTSESAAPYTVTINVTAVNDAATGAPTITGTARVGQVLTADASGIADVDGLPAASTFAWQWLQVDSGSDTVIAGATAGTYRLAAGDAGKKLKVRVGFTDLDGTAEALTSAAYPAALEQVVPNAVPTSANLAVTVDEDTSYTFQTGDFAFADEDDGDTLASVKITALPAAGTLALDGTAVTADQEIAASDLGKLVYTPPADANDPGYASFTFKVSDGTSESAAPYTVTINVTAVNDAATGAPTITGTARVGQVLTADASGIADVDGLPAASTFAWQWLQVDSGSDTVIAGATAGTYRLAAGDAGKKLKVRVGFTDLDGTAEALTSAAYPASQSVEQNAAPTGANNTVTVAEDGSHTFAAPEFGFADTDGDVLVSVKLVTLPAAGKGTLTLGGVPVRANQVIGTSDLGRLVYTPPADANDPGYASFTFKVSDGTSESAAPYTVTIDVTAVNDAATGAPTISGTARVGQVLTADASGIADVDGLPAPSTFAWQWLQADSGSDTVIAGATARTYRLAAGDAGKKFKVRVGFTDLDGTAEALTSAAYPASQSVEQNAAPTGANNTVTVAEDGSHTFAAPEFGFADTDGDVLVSVKLVTLPAAGKGTLTLGGVPVRANQVIGTSDLGRLVYTPPADANDPGYASFTFKVSDGTSESAAPYTVTIDVTAVNDAATGAPTISGTARVGQVLTADSSGIADVDGLPAASTFAWQWLQVDSGSDTVIAGATARTYRLVAGDAGKKFKVRVGFTDLDGTAEALTSAAYPASQSVEQNAAPTSANLAVTVDEDTSYTFQTGDFAFADTDGDVLVSVKLVTLPAAGKGTLTLGGVPVRANQVIGTSDLGRLVYTPPADANDPGYASFTFKVSDGTSESAAPYTVTINVTAVNDAATGAPTITGTARVGQVLTADASGIADVDGLPAPSTFAWQWLQVDSGSDTVIAGATAGTYRLAAGDAGKKLKVRVGFTDLDGTAEALTSAAYPASQSVEQNAAPTSANLAVTVDEDTSYTFQTGDFAFADTDGDVLVSVKLVTLPAAGKGTLTLGGVPVRANQVIGTSDLGRLVYTPPADANDPGYASFTFKVSDGTSESAAPYTVTINVTAVNDAATGAPTITGTARVGQVLTADSSGIADVDGLPAASTFAWQWLQVDSGSDTVIAGATAGTYRLAAGDAGKKLKVRVGFTDLDGTAEALTSAAYPASQSVEQNAAPTGANNTVTVAEDGSHTFAAPEFGFADTDGDVLVSVKLVTLPAAGKGTLTLGGVPVRANQVIGTSDLGRLVYTPPADANDPGYASFTFKVSDGTSESAAPYTVTIDVTAVNDAATGAPTISGTARVGQVLTADASGIADVDGLPAPSTFAWQWLQADSGSDTVIAGATARTYRLVAGDAGKKFKVRVGFTDLDGTAEALTSAAYPASQSVEQNAAPTSANLAVTVDEDTSYTFQTGDFAFADTDGDVLVSVKLVTLPAAGKGTLTLGGVPVRANQVIGTSDLGRLVYTPPADANDPGYASFTFKVSDGTSESAAPYTVTIDVTAVNDAATGAPTITGTARVGQVLTADSSGIADVDGLPAPSTFAWQWLRVDSGSDTVIAGATARTYRLVAGDAGKKFKVRVGFTDLDGTAEALTSAAYPASQSVEQNAAPTGANNTVTVAEDGSHTFAAPEFGFADTDGDVLVSVKLVTLPAAGKGTLTLGGVPVRANQVIGTSDLGRLVYTPPADANDPGYASFTFKVSDGTSESAAPYTVTIDVTAVNDAATGAPTITGTARVGQVLTADASGIADVDGLPAASTFAWQWLQVDSGSDTVIAGATARTYRLVAGDAGKKFKVRVGFTDLDGTAEALTSAAYPASQSVEQNAAPTSANLAVTVDEDTSYTFQTGDFAFADTDGDVLMSVKITALPAAGTLALDGTAVTADQVIAASDLGRLVYTPPADANDPGYASFTFKVSDGTSESAAPYTVTINVTAVNDAATGAPTISGTARVGQVLTADASGIADVDGLPAASTFAWQWLRVDSGSDTVIAGATARTYRLVAGDAGKKFKVRVGFTDLDGTAEALTSAAYPASQSVEQNAAPTGANNTVTVAEDGSHTFAAPEFGFADTDGDVLVSVKLVTLPAAGKGTLTLGGVPVRANQVIGTSDLGRLVYTPPADANDPGYASFTFKVSDGTSESAAPYTVTINVTAVNDAATGAPTITGTARVGQVLTADASGIADVDGLPAPSTFAWQWLQADSGSDTVIAGATARTYRLAAGDAGKKFKVRVGFTDLDGTAEALTSAAYPASQSVEQNAAPTSANLAVTVNEDTSYTFQTGDFAFADTDDGDVLVSVKLVTLPAAGKGTLTLGGVPVRANQVIGTSDLGRLVYTPPADANDPGYASFTFKVSDGTSESAAPYTVTINVTAVNDAATGAPTITGTARVGQVLTADASGIADVDGLPAPSTFAWQWLQVDSGSDTVIAGATAGTYRLAAGDAGKKLKVRVGFTDLDGTAEALTSAAYPAALEQVVPNAVPTSANLAVTVDEDTSYTFQTGDFAFADEDDGDTLASVKITALPAAGTLALDGTAVTADQEIAASDLGKLVYTPPADANDPGYASFTFKVSDGTSESAAPYTVTIDVTAVNDAATGAPTITGTARVGQVLTADASGIADVDGLPAASTFAWQWLQVDSGSDTVIAGATAGTYRLAAGDAGKKLKVRVGFTDLDGTAEALTSAAYPASQSVEQNAAPTGANNTVTVAEDGSLTFAAPEFGFADTDGDVLVSVKLVTLPAAGKGTLTLGGVPVRANQVIGTSDLGRLVYTPPADANDPGYASFTFKVSDGTSESAAPYTVTINVTAVNDAATGAPTITGTARVGQVLTADASGIADVDGLPAASTFAWQWLRVDSGSDTVIAGATARTYRLVAGDAGKKFKVRVGFTDLDGTAEALTSAAYPASQSVEQNAAPTSANLAVTVDEDTSYTFQTGDFAFADTDGDVLVSVKLVTLPAAGKGTLTLGGVPVRANQVIGTSDLGRLVYTPPADANDPGYASFTFKVSDGTSESAAPYTVTINVTAVNDAATGAPTITGTARVGQVLTADASGIADVDGLPAPSTFAWQWLQVDSGSDTVIAGATAGTYRLAAGDAGKKLKVRVGFTDLDGTAEALTSAAYPASQSVEQNAAPTSANLAVTVDEDTSYTFQTGDFAFADTDGDVLVSVKLVTLPAAGKGTLTLGGVPVRANQVIGTSDLGRLVYTPPADANDPGYASFTFKVSDGTSESAAPYTVTIDVTAVNDAATGAPTITGTARVGQVLTADASGIADVDGLPAASTFAWQWLQVDSGSDTVIAGATARTYRLVAGDAGKKFKVRVGFTDLDGTAEALTSAAYPASQSVEQNAAPTSANLAVTVDEDTSYTFQTGDFAFADTDGDVLMSVKITALPAAGTLALDGTAVTADQVIAASDLGKLVYTPPADANDPGYASFTFKVSDGTSESAAPYTVTINVTAVNDAATGAPTISGTARVGQVLTADASGIADVDGLPAASTFAWQWLQVDSGSDTVIAGATAGTYRLAAGDAGKKLKVRVGFTDLDGTAEALTSAAYPADTQVEQNNAMTVTLALDPASSRESDDPGTTEVEEHRTTVTASLSHPSSADTTVTVTATAMSPAVAGDFELSNNKVLTIAAGRTRSAGTVMITAVDNNMDGPDKHVMVSGVAANSHDEIDPKDVMLTIRDDEESPLVTLVLTDTEIQEVDDADTSDVEENKTTITASLSHPSSAATTVTIAPIEDVLTVSGPLTIPAGQTSSSGSVTLTALDNSVPAVNAMVTVSATAVNEVGVTGPADVTLTIVDDEAPPAGTLRLVDGEVEHEGRLEMYYDGQWGTICNDYWTNEDADVACKQLGYSEGSEGNASRYRQGYFGPGSGPIHLDDMLCAGDETGLLMCPRVDDKPVGSHNCRHSEDVGVRCSAGSPRISGVPALSGPGGDGRWGPGETFEVTVTFSEKVQVDTGGGTPSLEVRLGSSTKRRAVYDRGDGTADLVFAYELQPEDGTHATANVSGDSLELRGGRIRSKSSGRDAILDHSGASIAGESATAPALTAECRNVPASHQGPGYPFKFELHFSAEIPMSYRTVRDDLLSMRARVDEARRLTSGSNMGWEITVSPMSYDDIVITLPATADCTSETAVCTSTGQKLETGISELVPGLAAASVADAEVHEGPGATLDFVVTLTRPAERLDAVRYRTVDGTARAGEDYEAKSSLLFFDKGVTVRTVSVPVFDDAIDEGSETMRLELSEYPHGGRLSIRIADGTAIGTINNTDPMPKAWIARFGRTVAEQVTEAVENRLEGTGVPGMELTIAGRSIGGGAEPEELQDREPEARLEALTGWLKGEPEASEADEFGSGDLTGNELLTGSSFALTGGSEAGGFGSVWGGGVISSFDGREGELTLNGEVASAMVGADWSGDRTTAGLMISHSRGEGSYRSPAGGGEVSSTLTGVYPYGRYRVNERLSVWGVLGYGAGGLTLTPGDRAPIEADMDLAMAGVGARNEIVTPAEGEGPRLAVKTDGFVVRTSTEAVPGALAAAEAAVARLRVGLEGSYVLSLGEGQLVPSFEIGVRHDGGDAETGFGADIGAALAWSDPSAGVEAEIRARGLLTHEDRSLREQGFAGSFAWDPDPSSERGVSLSLRQTVGGPETGGMNAVFSRSTLEGLAANDDGDVLDRRRLEANLGYGFAVFRDRYTTIPEIGLGLSESDREVKLGLRLMRAARGELAFDVGVEGRRLDRLDGSEGPEYEIAIGLGWRLDDPSNRNLAFETRIEARRRESANDNEEPDHGVGLRLTAWW